MQSEKIIPFQGQIKNVNIDWSRDALSKEAIREPSVNEIANDIGDFG